MLKNKKIKTMRFKNCLFCFFLMLFLNGCSYFNLSSLNDVQIRKLLSTPASQAIGFGLRICDNKKRFFMAGEGYYFEALDSLGIDKEKDSLYYYEYLFKYYDDINVAITDINVTMKANGKELKAIADFSKSILSLKNFEGDTELFDEEVPDYILMLGYSILIEGHLKNKTEYEVIMKEKQSYYIQSKNNKIISANMLYR